MQLFTATSLKINANFSRYYCKKIALDITLQFFSYVIFCDVADFARPYEFQTRRLCATDVVQQAMHYYTCESILHKRSFIKTSSTKSACFWRFLLFIFKPTNKKSPFIESTRFKCFDSEVPSFYFGSMPPFAHKLSCKSVGTPLNVISARSAVCFLQPVLQLSKKSSPAITIALLIQCCIYSNTLRMYTNTARSIEAEQRFCFEALTYFQSRHSTKLPSIWEVDPVVI